MLTTRSRDAVQKIINDIEDILKKIVSINDIDAANDEAVKNNIKGMIEELNSFVKTKLVRQKKQVRFDEDKNEIFT